MKPATGLPGWTENPGDSFVVGDMRLALDARAGSRITGGRLEGLRTLAEESPGGARAVVCLETRSRRTAHGAGMLPAADLATGLRRGDLLCGKVCPWSG